MPSRLERIEKYIVELIRQPNGEIPLRRCDRFLLAILHGLSKLYQLGIQLRLFLYRQGLFRHHTLGCQVISVGNLTVGGTGKTPVVELFARELARQGRKVAILSRGYKKNPDPWVQRLLDVALWRRSRRPPRIVSDGARLLLNVDMSGDEPYMLASNLRDVVVLVDKDRVKSGRYAIHRFGCDTLILDDGFQYLALKPRTGIVLVDRLNPFGNGHVLPRGFLREPVRNLRRADLICITKSDGTDSEALKQVLRTLNTRAEIAECRYAPRHLQNVFTGKQESLDWLRGRRIVAVSGIAEPKSFELQLEELKAVLIDRWRFLDHHRYTQQELIDIVNRCLVLGGEGIVTTEKDAVRFPRLARWDVPLWFLRIDIEFIRGAEAVSRCISQITFQ